MKANDLAAPMGTSFSFENVGDTIEGLVVYVGDFQEQINKFNGNVEQVARVGLSTGGGDVTYVWPRKGSPMASAIADALRAANLDELTEGQTMKLRFDSEKDTGKGQPMKVYRAKIGAADPETIAAAAPPESEPF